MPSYRVVGYIQLRVPYVTTVEVESLDRGEVPWAVEEAAVTQAIEALDFGGLDMGLAEFEEFFLDEYESVAE